MEIMYYFLHHLKRMGECHAFDEFVKRYPVQPVYDNGEIPLDDLYDELEFIKDKTARGFIETRKNDITRIYEIA